MEPISPAVQNAISEAFRLEVNGRKFYKHAARVTDNENGKAMFERLAKEETEHIETFTKLFDAMLGGTDWKKSLQPGDAQGPAPLIEKLKASEEADDPDTEIEAIRLGLELERNAIEFFRKSADAANDETAKAVFERIGREEQVHYDLLQAQYDSVTKSEFWFDTAEFYMDGKY
jgi:rubrerythrin